MIKVLIFFAGVLAGPMAFAGQLTCPRVAPETWGYGPRPLEAVRVMSYPVSTTPSDDREYYAAPPWDEREKAGFIYQIWHLNHDIDEFTYEVDCVYAGTTRYFNLDTKGVRLCIARWRARRDHGVAPHSLSFHCKK